MYGLFSISGLPSNMAGSFHPMQLMAPVLVGGLLLAAFQIVRSAQPFKEKEFGFSSLFLLSWLNIFSYFSGFSIGVFIAGFTFVFGLVLTLRSAVYRAQLAFVSLVSLLLALTLGGWFPTVIALLKVTLVGGFCCLCLASLQVADFGGRRSLCWSKPDSALASIFLEPPNWR